jgi:hypothetical protein
MRIKFITLQPIKSANQQMLATYWDYLASGRRFPAFTEFNLEPGIHDPGQLVVWNIEGEGQHLKFRALYQGENVAEVFSSAWAGKTMDQVVPMSLRRVTLDAAKECARSGCLIYTIVSTTDTHGNRVDCERLLLPFGHHGSKVEQILGSLQLKSIPGGIRRNKILNHFQIQADVTFSGKIKSGFTKADAASTAPAIDGHEIESGIDAEPNKAVSKGLPALFGPTAAGEHRGAARRNILRAGRISFAKESMTCTILNISATGAAIEVANSNGTPDSFTLVMEMESAARPCTVVWRKETQMGVRFS